MKKRIKELIQLITRKKTPILLGELNNTILDTDMGFSRGMPIDRFYIENFLEKNQPFIKGDILEIGEDFYSQKFGEASNNCYIFDYHPSESKVQKNRLIGSLEETDNLPENMFDCFICTNTLNFIYNTDKAINSITRLLKPGGVLLLTVAGLTQISRFDMDRWGDYWRFTDLSLKKLFTENFKELEIETYGNLSASIAMLRGACVQDFMDKSLLLEQDPNYQVSICLKAIKK
jgi:SAM-dependent methyltransferase